MSAGILVEWGHEPPKLDRYPDGCGWGQILGTRGNRVHVVPFGAYSYEALCGKVTEGAVAHVHGTLCPDCARRAGVRSVDDLARDEREWAWKHGTPVDPDAATVDAPSSYVPECPGCGARPAQAHDPLCSFAGGENLLPPIESLSVLDAERRALDAAAAIVEHAKDETYTKSSTPLVDGLAALVHRVHDPAPADPAEHRFAVVDERGRSVEIVVAVESGGLTVHAVGVGQRLVVLPSAGNAVRLVSRHEP